MSDTTPVAVASTVSGPPPATPDLASTDGHAEQRAAPEEENAELESTLPTLPRAGGGAALGSREVQPVLGSEIPDSEDLSSSPSVCSSPRMVVGEEVTGRNGDVLGSGVLMEMIGGEGRVGRESLSTDGQSMETPITLDKASWEEASDLLTASIEDQVSSEALCAGQGSVQDSDMSPDTCATKDLDSNDEVAALAVTAARSEGSDGSNSGIEDASKKFEAQCAAKEAESETEKSNDAKGAWESSLGQKTLPSKEVQPAQDKGTAANTSLSAHKPRSKTISTVSGADDRNGLSVKLSGGQGEDVEMANSQLSSTRLESGTRLPFTSPEAPHTIEGPIISNHAPEYGNTISQLKEGPDTITAIKSPDTSVAEASTESKDMEMTDAPLSPVQASTGIKRNYSTHDKESDLTHRPSFLPESEANSTIPFIQSIASSATTPFKKSADDQMTHIPSSPAIKDHSKAAKVPEQNTKASRSQQGPQNKEVLLAELKAMKIVS